MPRSKLCGLPGLLTGRSAWAHTSTIKNTFGTRRASFRAHTRSESCNRMMRVEIQGCRCRAMASTKAKTNAAKKHIEEGGFGREENAQLHTCRNQSAPRWASKPRRWQREKKKSGRRRQEKTRLAMTCDIRIGTSGYHCKHWRGPFYPHKLSPDEMLPFYAQRFDTVELNNSFYRSSNPHRI